ncbi:ATP-binding protein [Oscillibacter sp.]|uniref:ATP-binding protein n=1 Tax=Oscillibacter sp. TaxID=1945593 RepID=UPI0026026C05|nr:ATP-binding protein [Oscillibacter sp.]MDD3346150.1 ATP-binding protein [Oscillibacter sp.]
MYRELAHLLLYSDLGRDEILVRLSEIFRDWEGGAADRDALVGRIYAQIKRLLDLATVCGFDENLWQCYLTWLLMTNHNSFTQTCERVGASDGSVNHFAKSDFAVFRRLMDFDFGPIERDLGIDCFSTVCQYRAIPKRERMYNRDISQQVGTLRRKLASARSADELFDRLTDYYRQYGYGVFAMSRAFRIRREAEGAVSFLPISNIDRVMLDDLLGYEYQKQELRCNTEAFLTGKRANNVLLYGDAGTGKSTSVKALINEYFDRGLRMIEIYKHQFGDLSAILAQIKNRNYRFIIFIDDLSFEENEVEYKFLKAVIEGGVETRPDNVLIYATSNRRHLIRETWNDRTDMEHHGDIHRSDTMEEKLSLASRFGVAINFNAPTQKEYHEIVRMLAARHGIAMDDDKLLAMANTWEIRHSGFSGRTAQQFIQYLEGLPKE